MKLTPAFDAALIENRWFGLKLLSYSSPGVPTRVVNRLYLDDDPFEPATGKPRNNWKLLPEFVDVEGVSAGKYAKLADWGGWQTTLRTDGVSSLDFTLISLREVQPANGNRPGADDKFSFVRAVSFQCRDRSRIDFSLRSK